MSKTIPLFITFLIWFALPVNANAEETKPSSEEPALSPEDQAEYDKRVKALRAEYVTEKEKDPCEEITCSSGGHCEIVDGAPRCVCVEEFGYITDPQTGTDCVPAPTSPGWAREAAIAGMAATPVTAILGFSAFGTNLMEKTSLSMSFRIMDVSLIGLLGPTVAAGAYSARGSASVKGIPLLRFPAHIMYAAGTVGGLVDTLMYADDKSGADWPLLLWSGSGATAILLHSIDAAVSYKQALGYRDGESGLTVRRPWMWTSFLVGAAATAGAVIVGSKAQEKRDIIDSYSPADTLCNGIVVGDESQGCPINAAQLEAKKWAGATDMLIGVAATGLVMGGVLYFVEPLLPCPHFVQDVSLAPFASPDGAGLMLGGRF